VLSPRVSLFGVAGWDRNRFAGIRNRYAQDLGVKWLAAGSARDTLSVEAGGGLIQQANLDLSALNFAAGRSAARYRHSFSDRAYVAQTAEYIVNGEDTQDYRVNTETSLVAPINGFLSVKLGYLVRFQNRPPVRVPGPPAVLFRTTDYVFTSGLQVTF
jgi:putative salt-induced outer membrane protein YdiY